MIELTKKPELLDLLTLDLALELCVDAEEKGDGSISMIMNDADEVRLVEIDLISAISDRMIKR